MNSFGLDIFDKFMEPNRAAARAQRQRQVLEQKKSEEFYKDKRFARDTFNEIATPEQIEQWKSYVYADSNDCDILELEKWLLKYQHERGSDMVPWRMPHVIRESDDEATRASKCISNCLETEQFCREWLEEELTRLGWKSNQTGYDPFVVSVSSAEVIDSVWQAVLMAAKQKLAYLKGLADQ